MSSGPRGREAKAATVGDWIRVPFSGRVAPPWSAARVREWVGSLPLDLLSSERWFAGKGRRVESISGEDCYLLQSGASSYCIVFAVATFAGGERHVYQLPWEVSAHPPSGAPGRLQVRLEGRDSSVWLREPPPQNGFWLRCLEGFLQGAVFPGVRGRLEFRRTPRFSLLLPSIGEDAPREELPGAKALGTEQTNTSVVYGDGVLLKLYRRVADGIHPEVEMSRYLSLVRESDQVPLVAGDAVRKLPHGGSSASTGFLQEYVPGARDAWSILSDRLARAAGAGKGVTAGDPTRDETSDLVMRLADATAALHAALGGETEDAAFSPEPITRGDLDAVRLDVERLLGPALDLGLERADRLRVAGAVRALLERLEICAPSGKRTRVHGDYHLAQLLDTGRRLLVVDFEGEPARPLDERRRKHSPLRDVAGMLRSFSYATRLAAAEGTSGVSGDPPARLRDWEARARETFLRRYRATLERNLGGLLPDPPLDRLLLEALELEKMLYEVTYEAHNRPGLLSVPLAALRALPSGRKKR